MKYLTVLFFVSLLAGPGIALELFSGIRIYIHDIVLVILLLAYAMHRPRHIPSLWKRILGFAAVCVLSLVVNAPGLPRIAIAAGLLYLVRFLLYASLYWVVSAADNKNKTIWLSMLYGFGVSLAVLGLVQAIWYPDLRNLYYLGWDPHFRRLFSSLLDPNFTGIILVLSLAIGFSVKEKNPLWHTFQAALFYSLARTFSRSSILALISASVVITTVKARRPFLLWLIVAVFAFQLLSNSGEGTNMLRTSTILSRLQSWQSAGQLIVAKPIFGWGFSTLAYIKPAQTQSSIVGDIPSRAAAGVENSFLFVAATTGIVGLVAYLWLLLGIWQVGEGNVLLQSSLAAVVVHAFFINSLFYPWVLVWMWILIGVVQKSTSGR